MFSGDTGAKYVPKTCLSLGQVNPNAVACPDLLVYFSQCSLFMNMSEFNVLGYILHSISLTLYIYKQVKNKLVL